MEWLKTHWYWVLGGLVGLYIGYELFFSGSSSSASTPAATTTVSTDPNADALQAANIQAQSTIANTQIAANAQVNLAQIAQQQDQIDQAANTQNTLLNDQYTLAITNSNNTLGALQSNNGTAVSLASIAAALNLGTTQANDATQVADTQTAAQLAATYNTNQTNLAALMNTNATQLQEYGIQASVANQANADLTNILNTQTYAQQDVANNSIDQAAAIASQEISAQSSIQQSVVNGINAGVYNKGGQGGSNQILALSAVNGAPAQAAQGAAVTGVAANSNNSISSIISSIGQAVATGAGGLKLLGA